MSDRDVVLVGCTTQDEAARMFVAATRCKNDPPGLEYDVAVASNVGLREWRYVVRSLKTCIKVSRHTERVHE